jgi:CSLREA domain-containing protein
MPAVLAVALMPIPADAAATFTVTKTADTYDGSCDPSDCSLRDALVAANADAVADVITIPAGHFVLSNTGPGSGAETNDLEITNSVTLRGAGPAQTVIDANGTAFGFRVFEILAPAAVTITDMTITNAGLTTTDAGAAEIAAGSSLTMSRVSISSHSAVGQNGAAFSNNGTLVVSDSLIADNETTAGGAALRNPGDATFTNVTFSANRAGASGGAILSSLGSSVLRMNNVTLTANVADADGDGGGEAGAFTAGNVFEIRNTIVAGNSDLGGESPECTGTVTSLGHNVVGNAAGCSGFAGPGDVTGADPTLAALADNGGPTPTHALVAGSPAIDAGGPDCANSDQRGFPRAGTCDAGAYELLLCRGVPVNRHGAGQNDLLTGTDGPDGFVGGGGSDVVIALGGADAACLGPGNDRASGGAGRDRLVGQGGNDVLKGRGDRDLLVCGAGRKDKGSGGPGKDRARGCERGRA